MLKIFVLPLRYYGRICLLSPFRRVDHRATCPAVMEEIVPAILSLSISYFNRIDFARHTIGFVNGVDALG